MANFHCFHSLKPFTENSANLELQREKKLRRCSLQLENISWWFCLLCLHGFCEIYTSYGPTNLCPCRRFVDLFNDQCIHNKVSTNNAEIFIAGEKKKKMYKLRKNACSAEICTYI